MLSLLAVLTAYSLLAFLIANFKLYSLYGFYTNFFVLNLISTPGGIEAMGVSASTWKSAVIAGVFGVIAFAFLIKFVPMERVIPSWLKKKHMLATLLLCFTTENFIYIYADYTNFVPVLNSADKVMWYLPITAGSLLSDLGVPRTERLEVKFSYSSKTGNLNYFDPALLVTSDSGEKYNIVWLVAESWRSVLQAATDSRCAAASVTLLTRRVCMDPTPSDGLAKSGNWSAGLAASIRSTSGVKSRAPSTTTWPRGKWLTTGA